MDNEKEVAEGFNAGYLIEKYKPELARDMVKTLEGVDLPFAEGFVAGSKEYSRERGKSIFRGMTSKSKVFPKTPDKSKDKGFEIDR